LRYDFPGNIRELQNIIERAMVLARSEVISLEDLPSSVTSRDALRAGSPSAADSLPEAVETLERSMIADALAETNGVKVKAAEKLGITERNLRYKIKKLGIS
jgi:two-component system response regulator AtoC